MREITAVCPAKINLTLDITGKRDDGYHELKSIMQTVSLFDTVSVRLGGKDIKIETNLPYIPCDGRNTAYKAASAFFAEINATYGIKIKVDKKIPVTAGLAGGSADAAGVLCCLNHLFGHPLSKERLISTAKSVGADVPFCLFGGTVLAEGIGEILTTLPDMPSCSIVIIKPHGGLSAGDVYSEYDKTENVLHKSTDAAVSAIKSNDIIGLCKNMFNIFEPIAVRMLPAVGNAINSLKEFSPDKVLMSGSGSAVFAVFTDSKKASGCLSKMHRQYRDCFSVVPFSKGVVIR